jgi:hypothetical protein
VNVLFRYAIGLDAVDQMLILKEIVHFGLKLVQGISVVEAKRKSNDEVVLNLAPALVMSF